MADIFDKGKRSHVMSLIRGKDTKVELLVFRYLRQNKIYFQKHYRTKEGIVLDVALPRKKKAVFIDGDFWHGRTLQSLRERRGKEDFWVKKMERNIERDKSQAEILSRNGWGVFRIWESDIIRKRTSEIYLKKIERFLRK
jgi:DNA mismatch endonuclease (patch repair protein)